MPEIPVEERFVLLKNARIVTMNPAREIIEGDVLIDGREIRAVGRFDSPVPNTMDLQGRVICPGFVQTHIHLCQTIFRGSADDLELLDWLKKRIWPLEAAHTEQTVYLSAMLGGMELLASGTTTILTMETVRHTGMVFEAMAKLGLRAFIGKCMMDEGEGIPAPMLEKTGNSMRESQKLYHAWDGAENGRLHFALAPRFALACSRKLMEELAGFAAAHQIPVHSHAAENLKEVQAVRRRTGQSNVAFFRDSGIPGHLLYLAHCIWLEPGEMDILRGEGMKVLHCPSSNLKLGSGIAMVPEMLEAGIPVSLGADGAACNNHLDMFTEMRTAALLQQYRRGPGRLTAADILRMATLGGAEALGIAGQTGSIEAGKKADLVILENEPLHTLPSPELIPAIVYSYRPSDVHAVMVDGQFVYRQGQCLKAGMAAVRDGLNREMPLLRKRAEKYVR